MKIPLRTKVGSERKTLIAAFLIVFVLILLLGITRQTFGTLSRAFIVSDSAEAAKFDVIITAPEEFWPEHGESDFEYHFLSDTDIQGLVFQITNNGETEILCKPYINSDITYRIYVDGEAVAEFCAAANETISFWLIIAPDGLDTVVRNVELFVDIQQVED